MSVKPLGCCGVSKVNSLLSSTLGELAEQYFRRRVASASVSMRKENPGDVPRGSALEADSGYFKQ